MTNPPRKLITPRSLFTKRVSRFLPGWTPTVDLSAALKNCAMLKLDAEIKACRISFKTKTNG